MAESYITLSVEHDGTYVLSVSAQEGYSPQAKQTVNYGDAWQIANAVDSVLGGTFYARNQVSNGKKRQEKELKRLKDARDNLDRRIEEMEK